MPRSASTQLDRQGTLSIAVMILLTELFFFDLRQNT
jgi:hypothetical protein